MASKAARDLNSIEREQRAFDAQLDTLLEEHNGEFVLFRNEKPVQFFKTYEEAYRAGLNLFGVDQAFFVSEVKRREPQTTSLAWEAGVMFR